MPKLHATVCVCIPDFEVLHVVNVQAHMCTHMRVLSLN